MGCHDTRAQVVRPAVTARAVLALVVCVLALAAWLAAAGLAATPAQPDELRGRTDAQLATSVSSLDAEATRIGETLLEADARRDDIVRERDAARSLLGTFLAEAYKRGGENSSIMAQVLGAGSLREAGDRIRVAQTIGEHHSRLVRALDTAEAGLDINRVERARMITRLTWVQAQLVTQRAEQQRRADIRAAHAEDRAARAAVADQRRAAAAAQAAKDAATSPPGTLVSAAGSSSPWVPASGPPSAALIDAYLASKGSPMTGQGAAFMASGMRWQVDPRLLVAIAGAESSFGQVTCGPNNAWGWACPNDPADFATWADGIDTVMSGLRRYYLDEGRTSVSLIQQKYCPVGAANDPTGLNSHWAQNVTKFLLELGGNPAMVGPGPGAGSVPLPSFGGLLAAD